MSRAKTEERVANREAAEQAPRAKRLCPCGWHVPDMFVGGTGLSKIEDLQVNIVCPDCGSTFEQKRSAMGTVGTGDAN